MKSPRMLQWLASREHECTNSSGDASRWQCRKMFARRAKLLDKEYIAYLEDELRKFESVMHVAAESHDVCTQTCAHVSCVLGQALDESTGDLDISQVKSLVRLTAGARSLQDGGWTSGDVVLGSARAPPDSEVVMANGLPREDAAAVRKSEHTPAGRRWAFGNRRWRRAHLCARCHADPPYISRLCFDCAVDSGLSSSFVEVSQDVATEDAGETLERSGCDDIVVEEDLAQQLSTLADNADLLNQARSDATSAGGLDLAAQLIPDAVEAEGLNPFSIAACAARLAKAARPANDWSICRAGAGSCSYVMGLNRTVSGLHIRILTGWHVVPVWRQNVEFCTALERNAVFRGIIKSHGAAADCESYVDEVVATDQSGASNYSCCLQLCLKTARVKDEPSLCRELSDNITVIVDDVIENVVTINRHGHKPSKTGGVKKMRRN
eukprot:TRINITY_DN11779_c0_g1_i1.p1 TRINITY_DN11779_c0_g1~~TRINITY_DN11779_c0_g1_i1.p1  ORF type:complete len:438 (+),score=51.02 TRINITY_DN11779_c0_g1_i1:1044-2357(+)